MRLAIQAIFTVPVWAACCTNAAETEISFEVNGQTVIGTLETPPGEPAPVVLLLHGFTGSRDELPVAHTQEGVFSRSARLLAEAGYASLRIDFRGSGESDGAWTDTTFSGLISDAIAAIDWLFNNENIDSSRLAVLGWSSGGLAAAHAAAARPEVKALILWAPTVYPLHTIETIFEKDTIAAAMSSAPEKLITAALSWGEETTLKAAFFLDLPLLSAAGAIAGYNGPLKVIAGSRDTSVFPQPSTSEALLRYHNGDESLTVFDTDHLWGASEGPTIIDEKMVPASLEWLDKHL